MLLYKPQSEFDLLDWLLRPDVHFESVSSAIAPLEWRLLLKSKLVARVYLSINVVELKTQSWLIQVHPQLIQAIGVQLQISPIQFQSSRGASLLSWLTCGDGPIAQ